MTFQEAHKGKIDLVTRRNLSITEVMVRLENYYSESKSCEIVTNAIFFDCWTDGNVAIICTNKESSNCKFVAVANGSYMKLIEP